MEQERLKLCPIMSLGKHLGKEELERYWTIE